MLVSYAASKRRIRDKKVLIASAVVHLRAFCGTIDHCYTRCDRFASKNAAAV